MISLAGGFVRRAVRIGEKHPGDDSSQFVDLQLVEASERSWLPDIFF